MGQTFHALPDFHSTFNLSVTSRISRRGSNMLRGVSHLETLQTLQKYIVVHCQK